MMSKGLIQEQVIQPNNIQWMIKEFTVGQWGWTKQLHNKELWEKNIIIPHNPQSRELRNYFKKH